MVDQSHTQNVKQRVAAQRENLITFLKDICRIPSYDSQIGPVGERIQAEMKKLGFQDVGFDKMGNTMGRAIDATGIQFRMLNLRKGPAMHSPRAQADKKAYQFEIKRVIESQENLDLRQEIVEDLITSEMPDGTLQVTGVIVRGDVQYRAAAVVLTWTRPNKSRALSRFSRSFSMRANP